MVLVKKIYNLKLKSIYHLWINEINSEFYQNDPFMRHHAVFEPTVHEHGGLLWLAFCVCPSVTWPIKSRSTASARDSRHTDKYLGLIMTLLCSFHLTTTISTATRQTNDLELWQTNKQTNRQTNGRTLPSALSPCFAKATRSIKRLDNSSYVDK